MRKLGKIVTVVAASCVLVHGVDAAAAQKILSVDVQKVFESYEDAKVAQAAYGKAVAAADKELKEIYDSAMKLQEEISALNEKADNNALLDSAREKFRAEADEKTENLRVKEEEFVQLRQDLSRKFTERRNKEILEQGKAIEDAAAAVAKSKKADIVLNKIPGTLYVEESMDVTQLVIDKLNNKKN
ncbi:MAG: OmpH family outer membrane protein [Puniceicoccales bacterium]|jgi:Skp family chaperone for outer membrane proteins|nr:OmpH family outer membrane protein [Puniceicoccales bacterium]